MNESLTAKTRLVLSRKLKRPISQEEAITLGEALGRVAVVITKRCSVNALISTGENE